MIPITFNQDDTNNEKKGNVRAQDLASFLSIAMPKRAGVLDIFDNPCTIYQTNYGTGYATVTMHKGYINIYGRCIYVEEGEQVQIALPTDSSTVTGTFGIRINLGETGANEVTWFTKTTTLQQDDILNNEISGVYEFGLYTYRATANNLQLTSIMPKIENLTDYLNGANFITRTLTDNTNNIATTEFVKNVADSIKTIGSNTQIGSVKLPNGLILKWGFNRTPSGQNSQQVFFNDVAGAFSNIFVVLATPYNDSTVDAWVQVTNYTSSYFIYRVDRDRTDVFYLAIGV